MNTYSIIYNFTQDSYLYMWNTFVLGYKCKNVAVSNSLHSYSWHVIVFQNLTLSHSYASIYITFLDYWSFICAATKVINSDLNPSRRLCAVWDGDAIRWAGINTHMHVIQRAAPGGFESKNSEEITSLGSRWSHAAAGWQQAGRSSFNCANVELNRLNGYFSNISRNWKRFELHAAAETQWRVIGSVAEEASVHWLTGDRCQKAQLPWVSFNSSSSSLPLASCSSSKLSATLNYNCKKV